MATRLVVGLMVFFLVFTTLVFLAKPMKDIIGLARNDMDCDNESVGVYTHLTCGVMDISLFYYFVAGLISAGSAVGVASRIGS